MPSSTSRPGSFERRLRLTALIGIIGAPLVWLTAEEAGYVLAYQGCDAQSASWVMLPSVLFAVVVAGMFAAMAVVERRGRRAPEPQPLLAWMSIGVTAMMAIVMAASLLGPLLLRPCD